MTTGIAPLEYSEEPVVSSDKYSSFESVIDHIQLHKTTDPIYLESDFNYMSDYNSGKLHYTRIKLQSLKEKKELLITYKNDLMEDLIVDDSRIASIDALLEVWEIRIKYLKVIVNILHSNAFG